MSFSDWPASSDTWANWASERTACWIPDGDVTAVRRTPGGVRARGVASVAARRSHVAVPSSVEREREVGEPERRVGQAEAERELRRDAVLVEEPVAGEDALGFRCLGRGGARGARAGDDAAAAVAVQAFGMLAGRVTDVEGLRLVVAPDRVGSVRRPRQRRVAARVRQSEQHPRHRGTALLTGEPRSPARP